MKIKRLFPERFSSVPFLTVLLAVALIALLSGGCGGSKKSDEKTKPDSLATTDSTSADSTKDEKLVIPVEIASVIKDEVHDYILQSATVDTEDGVEVFPRISGVLVAMSVEEGDHVAQGGLLCRLEDDDFRLDRDKLKVAYEKSQTDFNRLSDMYEKQLTSTEKYEEAKYNLEQARISFERAELDLRRTRITAPIAGVVTRRYIKLGERVTSADRLFKIIDMADKIAVVHLPEREISRVRDGQEAFVSSDNLPGQQFDAYVKRISPTVEASSGTFKVTVGLKDTEEKLRPGMFVSVHIVTDTHEEARLIPKSSVVYENGLPYAFFLERDTLVRRVRLETGYSNQNYLEILSASVTDTDKVVVVGQNGLKDGANIKVVQSLLDEPEKEYSATDSVPDNTAQSN